MTFKTLLIPVAENEAMGAVFDTALLIAKREQAHIEGLHVRPDLQAGVAIGDGFFVAASPETTESLEREGVERSEQSKRAFLDFVNGHGISLREAPSAESGVTASWHMEVGRESEVVALYGRLFDLIVMGRLMKEGQGPSSTTLEAALFDSGRPVLIAPPQAPATIGRNIVIAWNGSAETARAMSYAGELMASAGKVTVVSVEGGIMEGPSSAEVLRQLAWHGIAATARHLDAAGRTVGEATMAEAESLGADLVIKGAYTQSRLRQMIFGGSTRHILTTTKIPVLMAH